MYIPKSAVPTKQIKLPTKLYKRQSQLVAPSKQKVEQNIKE